MATNQNANSTPTTSRGWQEFALKSFAVIVARKHGITAPEMDDLKSLSDEELEKRLRLMSEMAHLPPA